MRTGPSYLNGTDFSGLLSRKALLRFIVEFMDQCEITGSYWEFGVFQGESMKEAYYVMREKAQAYVGFDSFEGLPKLAETDQDIHKFAPHFVPGNFKAISQEFVRDNILSTGMPADKLHLVPGFFQESLVLDKHKKLLADKKNHPVVVYVDVDLYSSVKQVLDFILPVLQTGCWLLFDDYWCYRGASRYGTQKAIREFLSENKNILLQDHSSFRGWSKAFVVERLDE
jgi:O-methyltransferase